MSEAIENKPICKYNQTGFCKFCENCLKRHDNQVCNNISDCTSENCTKRHPNVCKNFKNQGYCRHKEQCAYQHIEKIDGEKLKDLLLQLNAKHVEETNYLRKEVKQLKDKVEKMENYISTQYTNIQRDDQIKNSKQDMLDDKGTNQAENAEKWYQCDKCEYMVKKKMTLKKHYNTKHSKSDIIDGMASKAKVSLYHCDECEYSCQAKKSFKKHKAQNHENQSLECEKCDNMINKKELDAHIEYEHSIDTKEHDENVCECRERTVCDKCLFGDGWLQ